MLPSHTDLNYFVEVAHQKNISRAAERLGISQPSLSISIKRLEESIGAPLLLRSKTGVELTKAGHNLVIKSKKIIQDWSELREEIKRSESDLSGIYSIGCHPSVALYTLNHFLAKMLSDHPALEIRLAHDLSRKITDDVIRFRLDFGIVINPVQHPDLVIRELVKDEVCFWHAKNLDLNSPNGRTLLLDPDLLQSQALVAKFEKARMRFDRTVTSSNLEVLASMVAHGCGVGILPSRVAKMAVLPNEKAKKSSQNELVRHAAISFSFSDRCCLVFRADMQKSFASRKISEIISSSIQN